MHELGHAVAARRAGAQAEISLNFLAGYASYVPTRPISRLEHIGISFAGPGIQIVTSVAILLAMGADVTASVIARGEPGDVGDLLGRPVIGLFNLVPILPLDGGNIVTTALDRLLPGRAQRIMLWISLGLTLAFCVVAFTNERYRGFVIVIGFILVSQLQMLGSTKEPVSPVARRPTRHCAPASTEGPPHPGQRTEPSPSRRAATRRDAADLGHRRR